MNNSDELLPGKYRARRCYYGELSFSTSPEIWEYVRGGTCVTCNHTAETHIKAFDREFYPCTPWAWSKEIEYYEPRDNKDPMCRIEKDEESPGFYTYYARHKNDPLEDPEEWSYEEQYFLERID